MTEFIINDYCVCCGAEIPEGQHICPECKSKICKEVDIKERRDILKSYLILVVAPFILSCLFFISGFGIGKSVGEYLTKPSPILLRVPVPVVQTVDAEEEIEEEDVVIKEEPVVEEVTEKYYDVPLSEDLQNHIFELCEQYNIDPAIVIAMIERESAYQDQIIGDSGNSLGLMQIQPRWHEARMSSLGCTDLLDPYQNVAVGIDLLGELFDSGKSVEWVLMAYNGGPSYANKKAANGIVTDYATSVLSRSEELVLV